ncbi:trichodiene synthase family protein [Abortiporus biennis]
MDAASTPDENLGLRETARNAIIDFITRTGIQDRLHPRTAHREVKRIVRDYFNNHKLDGPNNVKVDKYIQLGLDYIGNSFYYFPSYQAQAQIAIGTALTFLFDDGFMGEEAMHEMVPRFFARRSQLHPMLDWYIESMTSGMQPYFSTYSANAIGSSFLEYCNSEMLLRRHKDISLIPDSSRYIEYIRMKEGMAEAYAAFIWPECVCPDLKEYLQALNDAMTFICFVNDILSYYKEAKNGETGGHILPSNQGTGWGWRGSRSMGVFSGWIYAISWGYRRRLWSRSSFIPSGSRFYHHSHCRNLQKHTHTLVGGVGIEGRYLKSGPPGIPSIRKPPSHLKPLPL